MALPPPPTLPLSHLQSWWQLLARFATLVKHGQFAHGWRESFFPLTACSWHLMPLMLWTTFHNLHGGTATQPIGNGLQETLGRGGKRDSFFLLIYLPSSWSTDHLPGYTLSITTATVNLMGSTGSLHLQRRGEKGYSYHGNESSWEYLWHPCKVGHTVLLLQIGDWSWERAVCLRLLGKCVAEVSSEPGIFWFIAQVMRAQNQIQAILRQPCPWVHKHASWSKLLRWH